MRKFRSKDNLGLDDDEANDDTSINEIIQSEILRIFDDYDGGPVSISDIQTLMTLNISIPEIQVHLQELVDEGIIKQVYYKMYAIASNDYITRLDSRRTFISHLLDIVDQSVVFWSIKREGYFSVCNNKSLREIDRANFQTMIIGTAAIEEMLREEIFPVCGICTSRAPEALMDFYIKNHKSKYARFICFNCQDKLTRMPYITPSEKIRRIIHCFRAAYHAATRINRRQLGVYEFCILNFDMAQRYLFLEEDDK